MRIKVWYTGHPFFIPMFLEWPVNVDHRVHRVATAVSGVHSVMRVKSVLAGEGGGCTPTPSHYIYPHQ